MLSSDGDDMNIYSNTMYRDKEQYNESAYDGFGSDYGPETADY